MLDELLDGEGARSDDESGVVRWILVTDVRFDGDEPADARQLSAVIGAKAAGISEGLIRVSVGLEDVDDLVADFEQALIRI